MCRSSARLAEAEPTGNRHRQAHNSIFVPRTPRNLASQAGCAGQAGAVTKLASTTASVIPMSANVPPALVTSGPTAGETLHFLPFKTPGGARIFAAWENAATGFFAEAEGRHNSKKAGVNWDEFGG